MGDEHSIDDGRYIRGTDLCASKGSVFSRPQQVRPRSGYHGNEYSRCGMEEDPIRLRGLGRCWKKSGDTAHPVHGAVSMWACAAWQTKTKTQLHGGASKNIMTTPFAVRSSHTPIAKSGM